MLQFRSWAFPGQAVVLEDFNFTRKALLSFTYFGEGIVNKNDLVKHLEVLNPKFSSFRHNGEIAEDSKIPGGYRIRQEAMLWWIADEIFRTIRESKNFEEWLLGQKKSNANVKSALGKVLEVSGRLFEKGATTFMEAYIKQLMNP